MPSDPELPATGEQSHPEEKVGPPQYYGLDDGPDRNKRADLFEQPAAPNQVAESAGEEVVSETVKQIPVIEQSSDQLAIRPGEENYVQDPAKAEAMAYAGDKDETKAANHNLAANAIEDYQTGHEALPEEQKKWFGKSERAKQKELLSDQLYEDIEMLRKRGATSDTMSRVRNAEYGGDDFHVKELRWFAEMDKARAQRLEEWAGVLHDHPVNQEYSFAHLDVSFSPEGMIQLEKLLDDDLSVLQEAQFGLKEMSALQVFEGVRITPYIPKERKSRTFRTDIESLMSKAADGPMEWDELRKKFAKLATSKETTLGQVAEFYEDVFQRGFTKPLQERIDMEKQIIEDVKSGRASQPPTPEAPEQQAA